MPVTRISASVDWSMNSGAARWIGERSLVVDRTALVDRLADDVEDAAQGFRADRHHDRLAGVDHLAPRTSPSVVSMAMVRTMFSPRCCATSSTSVLADGLDLQRVQDRRQLAVELHVDDGADDLGDGADAVRGH